MNSIRTDKLVEILLNADVELFTQDMQNAINQCPQGMYDESAKWAKFHKNRYIPIDQSEESRIYCLNWRVRLFSLEDSQVLTTAGYFTFLKDSSKEMYHLAKIYKHLLEINKIKRIKNTPILPTMPELIEENEQVLAELENKGVIP